MRFAREGANVTVLDLSSDEKAHEDLESVAPELGEYGIRVDAVCPGVIDTDMGKRIPGYSAARDGAPVEAVRESMSDSPALRRWGHVNEVAAVVAFPASDDASYVIGVTLPVVGGCRQHSDREQTGASTIGEVGECSRLTAYLKRLPLEPETAGSAIS